MIDDRSGNKNYPLPHPDNIASQDVERIATSITMIDADIEACSSAVDEIVAAVDELDAESLRIPSSLVGTVDTELRDILPRRYLVVNDDATGFSTVEGGGGEGGLKGEVLVKRSDADFDTMWIDPRAVSKRVAFVNLTDSDTILKNNNVVILADEIEIDNSNQTPRHGLTQRQIITDVLSDSSYTYILCDEIDESAPDESDIATHEKFGRVKIGSGITVEDGVISATEIVIASEENYGLVKVGDGLNVENGVISVPVIPHADRETFGTVKLSEDFAIGNAGELELANKKEVEEIIYQAANVSVVENACIVIKSEYAKYRAFINTDTMFTFDWSQIVQEKDLAFELEIVADNNYVISFDAEIIWDAPCAGVGLGSTVIRFEKVLGNCLRANLETAASVVVRLLTPDSSADVQKGFICGHNGASENACACMRVRDYSYWCSFANVAECVWYIDFMRSTYVEYLEWVNGYHDPTATYFYIEGSVDRRNWKRLLTRENVKPTTYTLDEHGFFKHYRIRGDNLQVRYFRWFGFDIEDELYELQRIMPIMQSDSANGFVITSSGLTSGNLYNLTTDDTNTYANFEARLDGEFWVKYELSEAQSADMIDLGAMRGGEANRMPTWFKIEGSNDDETWILLLERATLTQWYAGETEQYWINNSTAYKYYRLLSIEQPSSYFALSRFRLYKKVEGSVPETGFIPVLSSASQGWYEVSASSTSGSGHLPYEAFDGNTSTKWASASGDGVGGWIQVKFPTETVCNAAWLTSRNDQWYPQAPTDFTIFGSTDGINFETLKTVTGTSWTQGEQKVITFFNEAPFLYYRIQAQTIQDGSNYFGLSEINFGNQNREYKRELQKADYLVPILNLNNFVDATGTYILTASSEHSDHKAFYAFDRGASTRFELNGGTSGWIQVELPTAKIANTLQIGARNDDYCNAAPRNYELLASNDGETWTMLIEIENSVSFGKSELRRHELNNETAFKFYRLNISNPNNSVLTFSRFDLLNCYTVREY